MLHTERLLPLGEGRVIPCLSVLTISCFTVIKGGRLGLHGGMNSAECRFSLESAFLQNV